MTYTVELDNVGDRLDQYVSKLNIDLTRSYIKKLIEEDNILVNDKHVKAGFPLKLNDIVVIKDVEKKELDILAKKINIDILYEDDDIIVINKEKGVVVHPGNNNYTDTLVNGLLYSHKDKLSTINNVVRPGIVHRIDKDTTGIIVVAKNDNAHKNLSEQFKKHTITREYIAIVKGIISEDSLKIDQPLGRSTKDRKQMCVVAGGRNSVTYITVLERFYVSKMTLIKANLETGRTHQIRVHMKYIGHPLLGDLVYGSENKQFKLNGHILHAKKLGFMHPTTNKYIEFSIDAPKQFQNIVKTLQNKEKNN